jgi:hypothetical protein
VAVNENFKKMRRVPLVEVDSFNQPLIPADKPKGKRSKRTEKKFSLTDVQSVKIIGDPIGGPNRDRRDGDGDGMYSPYDGAPDKTPVPPDMLDDEILKSSSLQKSEFDEDFDDADFINYRPLLRSALDTDLENLDDEALNQFLNESGMKEELYELLYDLSYKRMAHPLGRRAIMDEGGRLRNGSSINDPTAREQAKLLMARIWSGAAYALSEQKKEKLKRRAATMPGITTYEDKKGRIRDMVAERSAKIWSTSNGPEESLEKLKKMKPGSIQDLPLISGSNTRYVGDRDILPEGNVTWEFDVMSGAATMDVGEESDLPGLWYDEDAEEATIIALEDYLQELIDRRKSSALSDDEKEELTKKIEAFSTAISTYDSVFDNGTPDEKRQARQLLENALKRWGGPQDPDGNPRELILRWAGDEVSLDADPDYYMQAGGGDIGKNTVSGGRFEVISVGPDPSDKSKLLIRMKQTHVFDPRNPVAAVDVGDLDDLRPDDPPTNRVLLG